MVCHKSTRALIWLLLILSLKIAHLPGGVTPEYLHPFLHSVSF